MLLYEVEGKTIFKSLGIPVPRGEKAATPEEAKEAAQRIGKEVVLKAQISSGGRGKAGVVKFAQTPEEAKTVAEELLSKKVKGEKVKLLLVEEKISIAHELYLGITLDPVLQKPVIIGCTEGGVDIEEVAEKTPEKIFKQPLEVLKPVKIHQATDFMRQLGFHGAQLVKAGKVLFNLVNVFFKYDATTVEINPLVVTGDSEIIAADSKLVVDDSSSYRHQELPWERLDENLKPLEKEAKEAGFPFVLLENGGYIGIIGGGAGVGDPVNGLTAVEALELFKDGEETKAIVLIGEIGGSNEELVAEYIENTNYPKQVYAFIGGQVAPQGKRLGHAGAIVQKGKGTAESKMEILKRAGVKVAKTMDELVNMIKSDGYGNEN